MIRTLTSASHDVVSIRLLLFMFCVGLELPLDVLRQHWRKSLVISAAGIVVPFGFGAAASVPVYLVMPAAHGTFMSTLMFCAVVMSLTAFPVLARILTEMNLLETSAGGGCDPEGDCCILRFSYEP